MRIALTEDQISRIWVLATGTPVTEDLWRWLAMDHVPVRWSRGRTTSWSVLMPPDAWLWVRDLLIARCYHANGRPQRGIEREASWNTLCRVVVTAVNRRQAHPALTGRAVAGAHIEIIPCWTDERLHAFYSMANEDAAFAVLVPTTTHRSGLSITEWKPGVPSHDSALMEQSAHLIFRREVEVLARNPD